MVQKITNRVLEVTDAELENLGECDYRVKLVNHRANLQQGEAWGLRLLNGHYLII